VGEGIRLSARIIRWSVWSRAMVSAFGFKGTVHAIHEWGHDDESRARVFAEGSWLEFVDGWCRNPLPSSPKCDKGSWDANKNSGVEFGGGE